MSSETTPAGLWSALTTESHRIKSRHARYLTESTDRFVQNHRQLHDILIDWSRQRVDEAALASLHQYASARDTLKFLHKMSQGEKLNVSEERAVMHMALRNVNTTPTSSTAELIVRERNRMLDFAEAVRRGSIRGFGGHTFTDVVHIGIGGSHLGPALVCDALPSSNFPNIHFVTNIDRRQLQPLLSTLDPSRTLFVVATKSYSTPETLANAEFFRAWMKDRVDPVTTFSNHFVHITSKPNPTASDERTFLIPESVGGRYSLWSAMGLPIALAIGREQFLDLLRGAHAVDRHALSSPIEDNLAVLLALLSIWNVNLMGANSHLVLPYDSRLKMLPAYCQQLEMESNGKHVTSEGSPIDMQTSPVVWGGLETDGQHAWHQFLHQGTQNYSADFIVTLDAMPEGLDFGSQNWIIANALSQSSLMLRGKTVDSAQKYSEIPGNHGSTVICLKSLNAYSLGALLALFEHKVAIAGHLLGINSFDQWGVEEGKRLADQIHAAIADGIPLKYDFATAELVRKIRELMGKS